MYRHSKIVTTQYNCRDRTEFYRYDTILWTQQRCNDTTQFYRHNITTDTTQLYRHNTVLPTQYNYRHNTILPTDNFILNTFFKNLNAFQTTSKSLKIIFAEFQRVFIHACYGSINALLFYLTMIHFNITCPSALRSFKWPTYPPFIFLLDPVNWWQKITKISTSFITRYDTNTYGGGDWRYISTTPCIHFKFASRCKLDRFSGSCAEFSGSLLLAQY